jgi:PAS domain S-box-containing protein
MLTIEEQGEQTSSNELINGSNFETPSFKKLFLFVSSDLTITYVNEAARTVFNLSTNPLLNEINSDPELLNLLEDYQSGEYRNLSLEIRVYIPAKNHYDEYTLEIETAKLDFSEQYILVFTPSENSLVIANRINTIHAAIEHGNLSVMILSSEAKITFISSAFEELLENSIDKLYGKYFGAAFVNILQKEDLFEIENAYLEKRKWSKVVAFVKEDVTLHIEIFFKPINDLADDSNFYMIIANDITDHIEKNILTEQSKSKLKTIINNINDPLLVVKIYNENFLFEIANNQFLKLFNFKRSEVQGSDIRVLFSNDFLRQLIDSCKKLITEKTKFVEYSSAYQFSHYQVKVSEMNIDETSEKFICVSMNDNTEQQNYHHKIKTAYKKEVQLNKLKTNFIENISHEIRTPFNAIAGYADIIEDSLRCKDYDSISELIVLVKEVLSRVSGLFDQIIEMSELESGDMSFNYVYLNCNQVLKSVYNKLSSRANQKGIDLILKIPDDEIMIKVDWLKLEKIIYALSENSIKYTHYGKVILRSFLLNDFAYITVTDTGEGMNQEDVEKLLKPFSQEEEGYTRNYQGAGLGLTVASRLTKLMGGIFDIVSSKQSGTKVILSFPLVKVHPDSLKK